MKFAAALVSGIVAGILDICGAILVYVFIFEITTPGRILQSIAAGLYGKDTYNRGINSAIIGLGFHFIIACIFALIYVFVFRNIMRKITGNKLITGIVYGCLVWAAMNYVVMPLSALGRAVQFKEFKFFIASFGLIILCVGIPITYISEMMLKKKEVFD